MNKIEQRPIMSKVVSNKNQLTLLVDLLCQNPHIAKGLCSKPEAEKKFEEFAIELNKLGPPEREWHKWMRVWTDLKCKIKKKTLERNAVPCPPGEDRNPRIHLTSLEERVAQLLDYDSLSRGMSPGSGGELECDENETRGSGISADETKGVAMDFEDEMQNLEMDEFAAIKSEPVSPETMRMPRETSTTMANHETVSSSERDEYQKILVNQATAQREFFKKMTELMGDVRRSMNNIEDYIKSSVKQKNSLLELKKQKLKAYNTSKMQQRIDARVKLKLQSDLLEIKKKKQEHKMATK